MLSNSVKMVIWDLDDTFWKGTLAEGEEITPIASNVQLVRDLAARGIVSSICSRNDHNKAKGVLQALEVWDFFVFPRIEFASKGANILGLIEEANLRPDNVLFIDDNYLNLQEAKHFAPTLMTALPEDILSNLLNSDKARGKPDPKMEKLAQYKNLERKKNDWATTSQSNEDFLRTCGIKIEIDFDFDKDFERVVEIANKTTQLNFTKIRIETDEEKSAFHKLCSTYGNSAGIVRVTDNYGDYGIVGYFVTTKMPGRRELIHFAFSCRAMNMGVEQYVFEKLGSPNIKVVPPVANPIVTFPKVDWITEIKTSTSESRRLETTPKLVLLGSCELLQLSAMCSDKRTEFVNSARRDGGILFADAGFIMGDPKAIADDRLLYDVAIWDGTDKEQFDSALREAEVFLIAPLGVATWNYFRTRSGNLCRIPEATVKRLVTGARQRWFLSNFTFANLGDSERLNLMVSAMRHIAQNTPPSCRRFALGVISGATAQAPRNSPMSVWRAAADAEIRKYCADTREFEYIDVEKLVPQKERFDDNHYSRRGYLNIANEVNARLKNSATAREARPCVLQAGVSQLVSKLKSALIVAE